jgi:hypothetical protein
MSCEGGTQETSMNKHYANKVIETLDDTAGSIERLAKAGKIDAKVASGLIRNIDAFADKFHVAAFGQESFDKYRQKVALVIEKDPDEKYMDTYDNPQKVIESDPDESYMHKTNPSFNSGSIDTYDSDRSSTVSKERKEYAPRDLSEWADKPKQQPSWAGGSAGKSTKQGSVNRNPRSPNSKTWAP